VHLVVAQGSRVVHLRRVHGGSWSAPDPIGETAGSLAMCTYRDLTDDRLKLMLCLQGHDGFMSYCTLDGDRWSNPAEVGQLTDGAMSVAQFGASLYLVYKERRSSKMRVTSFNVAPFNRLAAVDFAGARAPVNDSSVHAWSPTDFVVGASARQFAALRNDYRTGGPITLAVGGGEMRLVHRGVYQDAPRRLRNVRSHRRTDRRERRYERIRNASPGGVVAPARAERCRARSRFVHCQRR
jgi:hypothetical protein